MYINSFKYDQHLGEPEEWGINPFKLDKVNLLVGKNAIGKTRCLNVMSALSEVLIQSEKGKIIGNGNWIVDFKDNDKNVRYELKIVNRKVEHELFKVNKKVLLQRNKYGKGEIQAEELDKTIKIGLAPEQIAVIAKRDNIQHPFLECLYQWADNVLHYRFANIGLTPLLIGESKENTYADPRKENAVVTIFVEGEKNFKGFTQAIIKDMREIGYNIESILVKEIKGIKIIPPQPGPVFGIFTKEYDLNCFTDPISMSQGMSRALSTLILFNYARFKKIHGCIFLDDIGEGLDFDRSTHLIKLLVEKVQKENIQLVMTTNDRFVMNAVPLSMWRVLIREGGHCNVISKKSNPKIFDDFEFTGLNNFDFFESEFWNQNGVDDGENSE